jgi:hypothetical protein
MFLQASLVEHVCEHTFFAFFTRIVLKMSVSAGLSALWKCENVKFKDKQEEKN